MDKKLNKKLLFIVPPSLPIQDLSVTDSEKKDFGYIPKTSVSQGVKKFINWYLSYYK